MAPFLKLFEVTNVRILNKLWLIFVPVTKYYFPWKLFCAVSIFLSYNKTTWLQYTFHTMNCTNRSYNLSSWKLYFGLNIFYNTLKIACTKQNATTFHPNNILIFHILYFMPGSIWCQFHFTSNCPLFSSHLTQPPVRTKATHTLRNKFFAGFSSRLHTCDDYVTTPVASWITNNSIVIISGIFGDKCYPLSTNVFTVNACICVCSKRCQSQYLGYLVTPGVQRRSVWPLSLWTIKIT